jgi:hypothetical protein
MEVDYIMAGGQKRENFWTPDREPAIRRIAAMGVNVPYKKSGRSRPFATARSEGGEKPDTFGATHAACTVCF